MLRLDRINLDSYPAEWQQLIKKSSTASFFQQPEWLFIWKKHFASGEELVFGIYRQQELIGIAPFSLSEKTVTFLGVDPVLGGEKVSDFGDIIAKSSFEKIVWKEIFANTKYQIPNTKYELNFVREDSPSFRALQELGGRAQLVDVAPYIDLPKTWEEYLASLNRKDRHELRRKIRKLEKGKAVRMCYRGERGDLDEFFRLMSLSSDSKKNFLSEKMKQFFQDIFTTFWSKKMLQLCFLKLNGVNIASVFLFVFKDELLLYNSGFDPKYSHLAPGLILKAHLIKQAIETGVKRLDFLQGEERYKYDLGGRKRNLYKISF